MNTVSGVGVLDKAMSVIDAVTERPLTLAELVDATGHSRATVHRLAQALEVHGLLRRTADGRFALGLRLIGLGRRAAQADPLAESSGPHLEELRAATGESVQLYVVDGDRRVCVAALDSPHELRTFIARGAVLPLDVGSAGRVLCGEPVGPGGWIATSEERAPGVRVGVRTGARLEGRRDRRGLGVGARRSAGWLAGARARIRRRRGRARHRRGPGLTRGLRLASHDP